MNGSIFQLARALRQAYSIQETGTGRVWPVWQHPKQCCHVDDGAVEHSTHEVESHSGMHQHQPSTKHPSIPALRALRQAGSTG